MSAKTFDRDRLVAAWDELGVPWVDESDEAAFWQRHFRLPASLDVGSILWAVGGAYHVFDAEGRFVGVGACGDRDFLERGHAAAAAPEDGGADGAVRLQGRYASIRPAAETGPS